VISGEEFERRIRKVSQLRAMTILLRRAAQEAYDRGESPYKPAYDVRSDVEYWRALARRQDAADAGDSEKEEGTSWSHS